MKAIIGSTGIAALVAMSSCCLADPVKEPGYISDKPLYAKLALDEKGTRLLVFAFDESSGTGKGYDTIYMDQNLNGDLTDDMAVKGTVKRNGRFAISCSFPPVTVEVPYNEKAKGVDKPWELVIRYYQFTRRMFFGLIRGETQRSLLFQARIRMKDERAAWQYSFWTPVEQASSLTESEIIAVKPEPVALFVETRPDAHKKGNTGIAAYVRSGANQFRCLKDDQPVQARVRVTEQRGSVVHSEDVGSEKLFFG
jgi:hypothetical protein